MKLGSDQFNKRYLIRGSDKLNAYISVADGESR
jgi:hypothetical protein